MGLFERVHLFFGSNYGTSYCNQELGSLECFCFTASKYNVYYITLLRNLLG